MLPKVVQWSQVILILEQQVESEDSMSMNTTGVPALVEYQKVHFITLAHGIELIKLKQKFKWR